MCKINEKIRRRTSRCISELSDNNPYLSKHPINTSQLAAGMRAARRNLLEVDYEQGIICMAEYRMDDEIITILMFF